MKVHASRVFMLVLLAAAMVCGIRTSTAVSPEAELLKEHEIAPDAAGATEYLASLFPSPDLQKQIDQLIEQLRSDDFVDREEASRRLARIGGAREALQRATRSSDAEVSHRARRLLEDTQQWHDSALLAVLRYVHKEKPPAMVPHLLRVVSASEKEHLRRAATDALISVATAKDAAELKQALRSEQLEVRTAAVAALAQALQEESVEILQPLLCADNAVTRLATVEALVNRRPRECIDVLVALLESDEPKLRQRSDRILRLLTAQQFGSVGDAPSAAARREIVKKWRDWAAGPGREAALHVPLPAGKARMGRVLVCVNQPGGPNGIVPRLVEFNELWQLNVLRDGNAQMLPFGCQGMPNGHRLYCDWRSDSIIELDENGSQTWQQRVAAGPPNVGPANVERLDNGNTLVAAYHRQQVLEIDRGGQAVWQIQVGGAASDAHQLENGNVLVVLSDQGVVAEFDRGGGTVWRATGLTNPWSARRLPNGNTLVACNGAGRVLELAPDARIVRALDNLPNCSDADILENGNLLIGYAQGLREVNAKGDTVREHPIGMVRRISIY